MGFNLFLSVPEVRSFLTPRGITPAIPSWEATVEMFDYEDEVVDVAPKLKIRFTLDGNQLILTVDDEVNVVDGTVIIGLAE